MSASTLIGSSGRGAHRWNSSGSSTSVTGYTKFVSGSSDCQRSSQHELHQLAGQLGFSAPPSTPAYSTWVTQVPASTDEAGSRRAPSENTTSAGGLLA